MNHVDLMLRLGSCSQSPLHTIFCSPLICFLSTIPIRTCFTLLSEFFSFRSCLLLYALNRCRALQSLSILFVLSQFLPISLNLFQSLAIFFNLAISFNLSRALSISVNVSQSLSISPSLSHSKALSTSFNLSQSLSLSL